MAAPARLREPDRRWADRPSPENSGKGRSGSGSRRGGTPCSPGQPRTGTARPRREPAPEARSGGAGAALGAAGRSHLCAWPAQPAPPVPRGWLASSGPRVLQAGGSSHASEPLLWFLQHSPARCAESDNHFRELFYHSFLQGVYTALRQKTYLCFCRRSGGIEHMDIKRSGSQPSGKGPSEYFTGTIRLDPLFEAPTPARAVEVSITCEPGAREAWHSHPLGQTLIVTAGCGRVQRWGGPIEDIRPGDVIWFEQARETLAWCRANHSRDLHCHSGTARRQGR